MQYSEQVRPLKTTYITIAYQCYCLSPPPPPPPPSLLLLPMNVIHQFTSVSSDSSPVQIINYSLSVVLPVLVQSTAHPHNVQRSFWHRKTSHDVSVSGSVTSYALLTVNKYHQSTLITFTL